MSDRYTQLVNSPLGRLVAKNTGLPAPVPLERWSAGDPVIRGRVLLGAAPGATAVPDLARVLAEVGADTATELRDDLRSAAAAAGLDAGIWNAESPDAGDFKAIVFDASAIPRSEDLEQLYRFFHPTIRRVAPCGRVILVGMPPEACDEPRHATAQRALEGFMRAVGKELRRGATAQLVLVEPGAEAQLDSTLRFLLSPRSAYVSGQVVHIRGTASAPEVDWERPLHGKVALVTGASRGIGASIASVLARDGAHVVGLDVPQAEADLDAVTSALGGSRLALDITAANAPEQIRAHLASAHGGVDVVVHNAGITRDKTLGRMDAERWQSVIAVNLTAPERITDALLGGDGGLRDNGRVIGVSSISGVAGNAGQANYSTSKAGVIGFVRAMAGVAADRGVTANAVAPGFIETQMTAAMPFATREVGRRMNSLSQGGLPVDVAETVAWLGSPRSGGITGNVVRVCGQSLIGA